MLLPLVPLRDVVIFPGVVTPLFVGRDKSINALQKAMADDKSVMLIAQRNADDEDPKKALEEFNKDQELQCIVFAIDADKERISLKLSE